MAFARYLPLGARVAFRSSVPPHALVPATVVRREPVMSCADTVMGYQYLVKTDRDTYQNLVDDDEIHELEA